MTAILPVVPLKRVREPPVCSWHCLGWQLGTPSLSTQFSATPHEKDSHWTWPDVVHLQRFWHESVSIYSPIYNREYSVKQFISGRKEQGIVFVLIFIIDRLKTYDFSSTLSYAMIADQWLHEKQEFKLKTLSILCQQWCSIQALSYSPYRFVHWRNNCNSPG